MRESSLFGASGNHQTSGLQSDPSATKSRAGKRLEGDEWPEPVVLDDDSPSPSATGPPTGTVDNGLLDPDLLCLKNLISRSSPPAASHDVTTARDNEEDGDKLPSLDSLLGLNSTRHHSNSKDALNQGSLTELVLPI
jgi:hypothetical protein